MQMGRSALPSRIWLGACQTALHPSWLSIWYFPLSRPAHCAATLPDLWGWHISKALMGKIDAHSGQHGEGQPATGGTSGRWTLRRLRLEMYCARSAHAV